MKYNNQIQWRLSNDGSPPQVVFFKTINGVELIQWKVDYGSFKEEARRMEEANIGIRFYQKNYAEMKEFVESVTLQQSNYQLVIVKALLENPELDKSQLLDHVRKYNPSVKNNIEAFNVLIRKGYIKLNYQDGIFKINSSLNSQNKVDLANLASARLSGI